MKNKFEDLVVYQEGHILVLEIYKVTNTFPSHEQFGLTSQIRRAAVSVVANIVEGNTRKSKREMLQFLFLAKGSLEEVKYFLILCRDLKYIPNEDFDRLQMLAENVGKPLSGLIKYSRSNLVKS